MSEGRYSRVLCLLIALPIGVIGCARGHSVPTVAGPPRGPASEASNVDTRNGRSSEATRRGGHRHLSRRAVIAEARVALGAVLTAEQVYFQTWQTFKEVPDTADIRVTLRVDLDGPLHRWAFSVGSVSTSGFVATARGRPHTEAKGLIVTLQHVRGQNPVLTLEDTRHGRGKKRLGESRKAIIASAKGALGAVQTSELVHYQKRTTFIDAAGSAEICSRLGLCHLAS